MAQGGKSLVQVGDTFIIVMAAHGWTATLPMHGFMAQGIMGTADDIKANLASQSDLLLLFAC